MKKFILLLFLGFFSISSVFAAFPSSIDGDGDGVPNEMEFWLRAHGVAVSESTPNTYTDTDGDGIPDLVEDNISLTDKNVNESSVATATGVSGFNHANNSGELAGQWDMCLHNTSTDVSGNIGTPDECESVYTMGDSFGISIMHSTSDQIKSYVPGVGYATTESYNSGGNVYSGTFSVTEEDGTVVISTVNATFDGVNGMTGTLDVTEDGMSLPQVLLTAVRRTSGWTGAGNPSGIYTLQDTSIDSNTGVPISRLFEFNPVNDAIEVSFNGVEVTFNDHYGTAFPVGVFYIPAVGVIVDGFAIAELEDLDDDASIDDTSYEVGKSFIMVLALPTGNNSGLFRGGDKDLYYDDINSNQALSNGLPTGLFDGTVIPGAGDDTGEGENRFYGRHHEPFVSAFTRNTTAGFQSVIALNNVPLAASRITVSGPGSFTTMDLVNESGGTTMADAVRIRNRANPESRDDGFVGLQVGISGADTHAVSNIGHLSDKTSVITSLFPNGPYTYSTGVAGSFNDPRGTPSVSASYTRPANVAALMDVANPEPMTRQIGGGGVFALNPGIPLNHFVLGSAKLNAGNGVDFNVAQSLTLTWQAVTGASSYAVRITCVKGAFNDCDEIEQFVRFVPSGTSVTIPANTLDQGTAYRLTIDARNTDNSLISTTTATGINNTLPDTLIQTNTITEGPNVVGWSNSGAGSNFEAIHRPGNTGGSGSGSGVGFVLLHGRCNHTESNVVSTLRRTIASDGYDTISIRLPADTAVEANNCNASSSPYSQFVAGAAYVVPEAVARVRQAMNELVTRNGSINRVVLVGFSLGTRLSAAAAAPSNHNTDTPVPIVGLILTGTRSGGGAVSLDTTTALAEIAAPILDYYMDEDFPAVSTAAARVAAYAGDAADYTQTVLAVNDPWGLVDGSTSNIGNPRHKFLGYESDLRDTVSQWISDNSGKLSLLTSSDIVVDFGGIGLWARMNDSAWLKLNNSSPDDVVTGDINGNGMDDVIADFGSTFGGIFIKRDGGAWSQLHNFATQSIATGDLDGNGQDDIVIDFGGIGLWARMNDSAWLKLNNSSPDDVVITDMDGNGADDVIADFGSTFGGVFVKRNLGAWSKLHNTSPVTMGTGDLDGNGSGDVIINFGGIGLWARMNNASWLKLHNGSPDSVVAGDVDGNGQDDVVASFGSTVGGVWQKLNLGGWTKLNNNAPDQMVMGDVDASGQSDLVAAFNSSLGGIFVRRNNGAWVKLHNNNPDDLAVGDLDGF